MSQYTTVSHSKIKSYPKTNPIHSAMKFLLSFMLFLLVPVFSKAQQTTHVERLLIGNEGGFGASNATISVIDPNTGEGSDGVFLAANGLGLGDVLQSLSLMGGQVYAVMNNSSTIVIMNPETYLQEGIIDLGTGASPRRMVQVNETMAYVSDLYADALHIVDLGTQQLGSTKIAVGDGPEFMLKVGDEVLVSNYGFGQDSTVMIVNTLNHQVTDTLVLASGPAELIQDEDGAVWVVCTGYAGDYDENWAIIEGTQRPGGIFRLQQTEGNNEWMVEEVLELASTGTHLGYSSDRGELYLQTNGVRSFTMNEKKLSDQSILPGNYYALYYEPLLDYLYLADAKDYVSAGSIRSWSLEEGKLMQEYTVGIIPSSFLSIYQNSATGITEEDLLPTDFRLGHNYPNPFNPSTRIPIELYTSGHLNVSIVNSIGQEVIHLVNERYAAGKHIIEFTAQDLPSGIYFVRAFFNAQQHVSKIILLK